MTVEVGARRAKLDNCRNPLVTRAACGFTGHAATWGKPVVRQASFFDVEERLLDLSAKADDLERIATLVDFALFRPELEWEAPRAAGTKGGRPAFDHVLMFKILLLQAMHGLSDEWCEYLIKDRLSFMRFRGCSRISTPRCVPPAIWR
jgi:hypothetical protein